MALMRLGCPRSLMAYSLVPTRPVLSCVTAYKGNVLSSLWKRLFLWRNADIKLRWSSIFLMSCTSCRCMMTFFEPSYKILQTPFWANMAISIRSFIKVVGWKHRLISSAL